MSAALTLDLPWVEAASRSIEDLEVRRGRESSLAFDDGIVLDVHALDGTRPSIGELALSSRVSVPTASKAVSQLEAHGLVVKHREAHRVSVEVVDPVGVAQRLAERTGWPGEETLRGYLWGRTVFD